MHFDYRYPFGVDEHLTFNYTLTFSYNCDQQESNGIQWLSLSLKKLVIQKSVSWLDVTMITVTHGFGSMTKWVFPTKYIFIFKRFSLAKWFGEGQTRNCSISPVVFSQVNKNNNLLLHYILFHITCISCGITVALTHNSRLVYYTSNPTKPQKCNAHSGSLVAWAMKIGELQSV